MRSFFEAFYFTVISLTTVGYGYGDITPLTTAGRVVTVLMISSGVLLIPWQLTVLVRYFVKQHDQEEKICSGCGLGLHEINANYCKICGKLLD